LGAHDLTDGHFKILINAYENPTKRDQVLWTKFLNDVETGKCVLIALLTYSI